MAWNANVTAWDIAVEILKDKRVQLGIAGAVAVGCVFKSIKNKKRKRK